MNVSDLDDAVLLRHFQGNGLYWQVGPFTVRARCEIPSIARQIAFLYRDHPVVPGPVEVDSDILVTRHRFLPMRVDLLTDGRHRERGLARGLAVPMVAWALNISTFHGLHRYFLLHAAVVERTGRAAVFPGDPGRGKSTLCAALISRGWRLFSDELALIDPIDGHLVAAPRPINLKNNSIPLIREFAPDAVLGPSWGGTLKGTVAHMLPPRLSITHAHIPANPGWLILPAYTPGTRAELRPLSKGNALIKAGRHAFNFGLFGQRGFEVLADLVDHCECYEFVYSDLEEAVAALDALAPQTAMAAAPP